MLQIFDVSRLGRITYIPCHLSDSINKSLRLTEDDLYWNRLDNYLDSFKQKSYWSSSDKNWYVFGDGIWINI
jgi:hypothetical protein